MKLNFSIKTSFYSFYLISLIFLGGCSNSQMRSLYGLNSLFSQPSISYREPSLGLKFLATIVNDNGQEKIKLFDLRGKRSVALPGINRFDAQPISVSISANGARLALIRQRVDQTELLLYRRNLGTLQRLEISPKGIPRRVSIDASGKILAVQVSREGRWYIDVIRLQS